MHKLECVAMSVHGENWCPSETVRLVARTIMKQVKIIKMKEAEWMFSFAAKHQICAGEHEQQDIKLMRLH